MDFVRGLSDLDEWADKSSVVSIGSPASRRERFGGVHTSRDACDLRLIDLFIVRNK